MKPSNPFMNLPEESGGSRIVRIAAYIDRYIEEHWQAVLEGNGEKLRKAYEEGGDTAYGTYMNLLLLPVHRQMKEASLRPEPRLPGDFDISREWGSVADRQRWMWSAIYADNGDPLGTIVTVVHHDHTQYRIPRRPEIMGLKEVGKEPVVAALSALSTDFAQANEFTVEYELYLKSLGHEDVERQR